MKKIFPALCALLLCGCWFMNKPQAVVIATDQDRAGSLITALRSQDSALDPARIEVKLVKRDDSAGVVKALDWASEKGVRTVGIDDDCYRPGDALVTARLQALRAAGVYVAGMRFSA